MILLEQMRAEGVLATPPPALTTTRLERAMADDVLGFWSRVDKTGDCWTWTSYLDRNGYGRTPWRGRNQYTHRIAFELAKGPIPAGTELDHLCRNPSCCNPDHLDPVSHAENMRRGHNGRKTHCPQGHEYTPDNTYRSSRAGRLCKVCVSQRQRRYESGIRVGHNGRLTAEQREFIRQNYTHPRGKARGQQSNAQALADQFGVTYAAIRKIVSNERTGNAD